jgi:hypothetical protein
MYYTSWLLLYTVVAAMYLFMYAAVTSAFSVVSSVELGLSGSAAAV